MLKSETWTNKKKEVVEDHDHPRPEGTRNMKKRSLSHLSAIVYYMVSLFLHRQFWLYFPFIFIAMLIYYPHWNSYWFRCRFIIIALFQYHSHCHRFCYYDIFHLSYFRVFCFYLNAPDPSCTQSSSSSRERLTSAPPQKPENNNKK